MAWRRSVVYAAVDVDGRIQFGYSPRPAVDAAWYANRGFARFIPLHPSLPPPWADEACRRLQQAVETLEPATFVEHALARMLRGRTLEPLRKASRPRQTAAETAQRRLEQSVRLVGQSARRVRRQLVRRGVRWTAAVLDDIPLVAPLVVPGGGNGRVPNRRTPDGWEGPDDAVRAIDAWPSETALDAVARRIEGRLLTELEIVQAMERAGDDWEHSVEACLTALTLLGKATRRPGLAPTVLGGWRCLRCGESENIALVDCAACGETECAECDECRGLGVLRACTLLYAGRVTEGDGGKVSYHSHKLTPAQARAAAALERFVRGGGGEAAERALEAKEALVWAVCGAGKTELCFPAVARVLGEGGRVLFAIPRRDIVRELGQRLRQAFPTVDVEVLHGGEGRIERGAMPPGTLTVATTHQALRFEHAFDLVIVDEVDAFPYRATPMLKRAVRWAMKPDGRIVHMTATPEEALVRRAEASANVKLITVPVRHHGHPLPVPVLHRVPGLQRTATVTALDRLAERFLTADTAVGDDDGDLERFETDQGPLSARGKAYVRRLIDESLQSAPPARVIVFVPDVPSTEAVGRALSRMYGADVRVLWSHARDPQRDGKLDALRAGACDVFVATTILERGVTVPDVDVVVLFADDEGVYSEATLVQMAGRVGRSTERPTGRVHFVAARISPGIKRAVGQIQRMNKEAAALGLLRDGEHGADGVGSR